jgi:hypothetical protein
MDEPYAAAIASYFADVEAANLELAPKAQLRPEHHPTADGAVKMIPHHGDPVEAAKIRRAFRLATGGTE